MTINFSHRFKSFWRWLTEPADAIVDPERRRQARLLLSLLVTMILATTLGLTARALTRPDFDAPTFYVPVVAAIVLLAAYILGRTKYALWGAALTVGIIFVSIFWTASLDPRSTIINLTLNFLAMVVLLGSLVFSLRGTVLLAMASIVSMLLFPLFAPQVALWSVLTAMNFVFPMSALVVVAAAIRHRDLQQRERRSREMALLNRVLAAASASLEPYKVLEVTCRELALAFDVPQAAAALLNEEGTASTVVAEYLASGRPGALGKVIPLADNSAARYVLEHKGPLAVTDVQRDPRMAAVRHLMQSRGVASLLILPLIVRGRVVGTIGLDAIERREFSDEQVALAATAAAAAARSLEHAQLFTAEREARQLSETLSETAQELNLAPDLDTALNLVLEHMERVISFDSGSILLLEGDEMRTVAVRGFDAPDEVLGTRLDLDTALLNQEVIETRRPLVAGAVTADPRWAKSVQASKLTLPLKDIHSWMGIPLLIQDRVIGMLTADKVEPDFYQSRDTELALAFAGHAAGAIENARLLESERAQLRLAKTLQEVGALLTVRLSLDEVFEQIFDLLARVIAYDTVCVQLLDKEGNMELVAGRGFPDIERVRQIVREVASQTLEERWGERRVIIIPDTHRDERWIQAPGSEYIRSWIGAALVVKGQVVGTLNVDSATVNAYDAAMGETAAAFANQAAVAIENARLYDRVWKELTGRKRVEGERGQLLADLERRSNLLQTAAEVSKSASANLDPGALMDQMVNLIAERFGFDYTGIFLVDEAGEYAVLQAGTGNTGRQMLAAGHKLAVGGESMIGWSVAHAQARIALDADKDAVRLDNPLMPETRSEMALPLISRGRCIGGVTVQSRKDVAFSDEDIVALQTMADQSAVAIENAWLYKAAQQEIAKRKRTEEIVRQLNESLERRVVERTAELAAVNQELEAFAYSVSHDLRAPLRRIDSFSRALQEDYPDRLDADGRDYLFRLDAASQHMTQLIDALLDLSRITRQEIRRARVDLSDLAHKVAVELQETKPERQVEFIIAEGLAVNGDARLLRVALENLMGNAWKFTAGRPQAQIQVGALWQHDDESAYFVRDNGAGFDMAYADRLFAAFQRLHSTAEFEGTGIGLATVQRIIHRHGGRVWAEGTVDQGATFYFAL